MKRLLSPEFMVKFHGCAVLIWLGLIIPSLLWWQQSVPWLVAMSLWANLAAHWAGFQAAHAEQRVKDND